MNFQNFLSFDIGNVVSWAILGIGWVIAMRIQAQVLKDKLEMFETWAMKQENKSDAMDRSLREQERVSATLGKLAEYTERRLKRLEDTEDRRRSKF